MTSAIASAGNPAANKLVANVYSRVLRRLAAAISASAAAKQAETGPRKAAASMTTMKDAEIEAAKRPLRSTTIAPATTAATASTALRPLLAPRSLDACSAHTKMQAKSPPTNIAVAKRRQSWSPLAERAILQR